MPSSGTLAGVECPTVAHVAIFQDWKISRTRRFYLMMHLKQRYGSFSFLCFNSGNTCDSFPMTVLHVLRNKNVKNKNNFRGTGPRIKFKKSKQPKKQCILMQKDEPKEICECMDVELFCLKTPESLYFLHRVHRKFKFGA